MYQYAINQVNEIKENSGNVIRLNRKIFNNMAADACSEGFDSSIKAVDDSIIHKGMDNFPLAIYNDMLAYSLNQGKFRNAMMLVCMANWGMRFSDLVRVRFGHIFDEQGKFKESFTLGGGEKKTKKSVVYYNNDATESVIELYLNQPENYGKSRLDYLFVSESKSNNKPLISLRDIEVAEIFDSKIEILEKSLKKIPVTEKRLVEKYINGNIDDEEYKYMKDVIFKNKENLENQIAELNLQKENYKSNTQNADRIKVQKPISHTAGEDIIKNTLKEIGINHKNRKDKSEICNNSGKFNTHSLRKTFADLFIKTGDKINKSGKLQFNDTILDLLKEKFKHSDKGVTTHYTNAQENAFKVICQNLNIGLDVLQDYANQN